MFGGVYGAPPLTCSAAVPLALPDVAEMVASPPETPVARSLLLTVAMDAAVLAHVNVAPVIG
jgi:hypothetical protein